MLKAQLFAIVVLLASGHWIAHAGDSQAPRTVIKIATALGVEKTMTVSTCVGQAKRNSDDPCVVANLQPQKRMKRWPSTPFHLIFRTDERIFLSIPFESVAKVTRQDDSKHLLKMASGTAFSGKMICSINGYDMATVDSLLVLDAQKSSKQPKRRGGEVEWRLSVNSPNKRELIVRNPRWAYTPLAEKNEQRRTLTTKWFYVRRNDIEIQAHLPDFQSVSLVEKVRHHNFGSILMLSLTVPGGKQTGGRLSVNGHSRATRLALFADTSDGAVVAIPHDGPKWTLTKTVQD